MHKYLNNTIYLIIIYNIFSCQSNLQRYVKEFNHKYTLETKTYNLKSPDKITGFNVSGHSVLFSEIDGNVIKYCLNNKEEVSKEACHTSRINNINKYDKCCCYSLTCGQDGYINVWNNETFDKKFKLSCNVPILSAIYNENFEQIYSSSSDGRIFINSPTKNEGYIYPIHDSEGRPINRPIKLIEFLDSSKNELLIVYDNQINLLDCTNKSIKKKFIYPKAQAKAFCCSINHESIARSEDINFLSTNGKGIFITLTENYLTIWDARDKYLQSKNPFDEKTEEVNLIAPIRMAKLKYKVINAKFINENEFVVCSPHTIRILDLRNNKILESYSTSFVNSKNFQNICIDEKKIYAYGVDSNFYEFPKTTLYIWSLKENFNKLAVNFELDLNIKNGQQTFDVVKNISSSDRNEKDLKKVKNSLQDEESSSNEEEKEFYNNEIKIKKEKNFIKRIFHSFNKTTGKLKKITKNKDSKKTNYLELEEEDSKRYVQATRPTKRNPLESNNKSKKKKLLIFKNLFNKNSDFDSQ